MNRQQWLVAALLLQFFAAVVPQTGSHDPETATFHADFEFTAATGDDFLQFSRGVWNGDYNLLMHISRGTYINTTDVAFSDKGDPVQVCKLMAAFASCAGVAVIPEGTLC